MTMTKSLDELRAAPKKSRGRCRVCGSDELVAHGVWQLREREVRGNPTHVISSASAVLCEACALRVHDAVVGLLGPNGNKAEAA